ncbi:Coproporphyrinogen III oxidase [Vibrio chagasii]|uniref:B12-binding domain-containing radical SAM protein n=1 Tax=Vibrio sp. 070316B TaxID=2607608 RepID=UPI0014935BAE|nr:radical SAM protein [Vibrio sp. 070316B]CAH6837068.1 Coproporphyrinogen III oxidase [Vibrio chagasii]NOI39860.1 radical SAM protein [Vibrio sp. 070316B]CAH7035599.1 Coproporphyrinogen III oxidase [Vibrio chagasii]CAH7088616.1 Coproporphyrinogen III oxidase [Vibrio chagasii]CAH7189086.1 Coproporphyrinogen III oxidase [Vibrio chagasii]
MKYEGKVYRPWIEAKSILIQTTLGCSINTCTFCNMFSDKRFKVRDIEDVYKDIEEARLIYPYVESIFLIDGNVMAARTDYLLKVLDKIRHTFPESRKISLYSGLNDFRRKSLSELKELKSAGLSMAYAGLESGDPVVLDNIKKRMTPEQAIEGMALAKEAGIETLLSFIFGLGGRERSREHIVETTRLLNIMKPEQIAPMALAIQPGTALEQQVNDGTFIMPTQLQILEEEKYLLENLNIDTFYWGDHGNNIVTQKGSLLDSREQFLAKVNHAITSNPMAKDSVIQTFAW